MNSKVTYRQQYTRCGKQRCRKCREGAGHGPYWYAYWSEKGRTVSKYIGTHLPEELERAQAAEEAEREYTQNGANAANATSQHSPVLRIYLLGQFRIERRTAHEWSAVDSRTWHRRRARALLGCLLSSPGRRLGREQVMELLWPDLDIDIAANRLNGAVHELRQILEPDIERPAASRMLRLERDILELADRTHIWVDAEAFELLLKEANTTNDRQQAERLLEDAASLYKGNYLLEELYAEWAAPRRDALQRAWVGLLLNLANLRTEQEAYISAIEILDRLRTADPTNETALQRLMLLLTQLDRRGEALQVYRQHVTMLERDYESDPLPETTELYEALRRGHLPTGYTSPYIGYLGKTQANNSKEKSTPSPVTSSIVPQTVAPSSMRQEMTFSRPVFQLGRHNQGPLIGRDRELESMRSTMHSIEEIAIHASPPSPAPPAHRTNTWQAAVSTSRVKRPHLILLQGEAGIGKTRLAEEISMEAYTRGWAVAWSRSYEQEGTIPYHIWTELLRTLLHGITTLPELTDLLENLSSNGTEAYTNAPIKLERLSVLLPDLIAHASTRSSTPLPYEQERLHLWEAALGLLGTLSKAHPLLLVLDDLHWTDESSIELLTYLAHHLQDQRTLLIATCRDGELPPQHKLRTLIADLCREQTIVTISVQPLTQSQIGTMVSHLPEEIVRSIQSQAAGNPFFAEELARYVGSTAYDKNPLIPLALSKPELTDSPTGKPIGFTAYPQKIERDSVPLQPSLPQAIAAVLERRLRRLSNGCQILLGKAAVLGGSFELEQLLPMANEHSEDVVLDLLEEALQAGLLTEEGTGAHITYHFWHPLIISHLYERLSAARRALLHRKAADAFKTMYAASHQEKVTAAIVYHLSRGGGDPAQVTYYAELAGNQAYALAAYSEAQQYYLQAIQTIINGEPYIAEGLDVQTQFQRIITRINARHTLTDALHICRLLEHVAECSMILGNAEESRQLYEYILSLRTPETFLQQAYPATMSDEEKRQYEAQIQALLWREIGNTCAATGDYTGAHEYYVKGKEAISRAGITTGAAWACLHLQYGEIMRFQGHYDEARHYLQEGLAMLENIVQQSSQGENSNIEQSKKTGSIARPLPHQNHHSKDRQTRTERALQGDPLEIGVAHERLGIVAASVGQLNEALTHMHLSLSIFEQSELISDMVRVCGNLGVAYAIKGEHNTASEYLQRSLHLAERNNDLPNMVFVTGNLGDLAHRGGRLLEAENWFTRSLVLAERINDRESMSWFNVELAAVQQDLGNLRQASTSLYQAIVIARSIKSSRCIRYALVGLGKLRIAEASVTNGSFMPLDEPSYQQSPRSLSGYHQLLRARSAIERAISLQELEVEPVIDGKQLLATLSLMLNELATAEQLALQALKEAQENEITRMIGRVYRILGNVETARNNNYLADYYFEQAILASHEHELRLDYARAIHSYGASLVQRDQDQAEATYQKGLAYLHEARSIFSECHATLDLSQVERLLTISELQNTSKL